MHNALRVDAREGREQLPHQLAAEPKELRVVRRRSHTKHLAEARDPVAAARDVVLERRRRAARAPQQVLLAVLAALADVLGQMGLRQQRIRARGQPRCAQLAIDVRLRLEVRRRVLHARKPTLCHKPVATRPAGRRQAGPSDGTKLALRDCRAEGEPTGVDERAGRREEGERH
eukprot:6747246-Prymnesium_polylepis.1